MTAAAAELASRATRSSSSSGDGDALSHVQHLRGMFPALEQLGYDIDELLAAGGLRRKDVEDPDAYVSPRNCSLVFTRAQEKRHIKNLALQLVLRTPVNSPLLEYLIVSSDTVEHGLQRLARYLRLLNPYIRILVDETDEPARVAEATHRMRLKHVVITAVARDDLADGGAEHFRQTIEAVRALNPATVIEVLTPDFNACDEAIDTVLAASPHIFNHNLETVRRLTPSVRSRATYDRSLSVLAKVKSRRAGQIYTKSGLMLGLGETEPELFTAMADLRSAGCDILTLGQYLQPTLKHLPVMEFVAPETFSRYGEHAREMGFVHVASGPMVRSSYHADEFTLHDTLPT